MNRLGVLTEVKLTELALTVRLQEAGRRDSAMAVVLTGEGRQTIDAVRRGVAGLLASAESDASVHRRTAQNDIVVAAVAGAGLVALLSVLLTRLAARLRRSQRSVLRMQERFRRVFEEAPVGMALFPLEPAGSGTLSRVNRALSDLTGRPGEELEAMDLAALARSWSCARSSWARALTS